jgi:hypothetical protein
MGPKYLNLLEPKVFGVDNSYGNRHLMAKDSTEKIWNTSTRIKTPENRGYKVVVTSSESVIIKNDLY